MARLVLPSRLELKRPEGSSNEAAIVLWRRLGFEVAGRLPGAFRHRDGSYFDALVMYRSLV